MARKWNTLTINTPEKQADESIQEVVEECASYIIGMAREHGLPDKGRRFVARIELKVADDE